MKQNVYIAVMLTLCLMSVLLYNCSDQPVQDKPLPEYATGEIIGQWHRIQIMEQGGMKYMIVLNQSGGVQVVNVTLDSMTFTQYEPAPDEWPDKSKIPDYNATINSFGFSAMDSMTIGQSVIIATGHERRP